MKKFVLILIALLFILGAILYGLDAVGLINLEEMTKNADNTKKENTKKAEEVKKEELIPIIDDEQNNNELGLDLSNKQVGDIIEFGTYEQDNDYDNGKEPIKWIILNIEKDYALLMSEYALDWEEIFYDYEPSVVRTDYHWSNSKIRRTLNEDFYNEAFNDEEMTLILTTSVTTYGTRLSANPTEYEINYSLMNTKDKIFLLSYTDVRNALYGFEDSNVKSSTRYCSATTYAIKKQKSGLSPYEIVDYCLRSQGDEVEFGGRVRDKVNSTTYLPNLQYVNSSGQIISSGGNRNTYYIRPACMVKIK